MFEKLIYEILHNRKFVLEMPMRTVRQSEANTFYHNLQLDISLTLQIPYISNTFGNQAFSMAKPKPWNSLCFLVIIWMHQDSNTSQLPKCVKKNQSTSDFCNSTHELPHRPDSNPRFYLQAAINWCPAVHYYNGTTEVTGLIWLASSD